MLCYDTSQKNHIFGAIQNKIKNAMLCYAMYIKHSFLLSFPHLS